MKRCVLIENPPTLAHPAPPQTPMTAEQIRLMLAKHRMNIEGRRCDPWYEYVATVRAAEAWHGIGPARVE